MKFTADEFHLAAYAVLYAQVGGLAPSSFIRWARNLKRRAYGEAELVLGVLGGQVPDIAVPGSGQPDHMLPRFQAAWTRMNELKGRRDMARLKEVLASKGSRE